MMNASEKKTPTVVIMPLRLYLGAIVVNLLLHWFWPAQILPGYWASAIGVLLIGGGVALSAVSERVFVRKKTAVNPQSPATMLVKSGPYQYSRNPMYVGLAAMQLGIALALNSLWGLLLLMLTTFVMHYGVILREEAYLERVFAEEYRAYKRSVRRWL